MAREVHSENTKIEQMPPIGELSDYEGEIIRADRVIKTEYLDELKFNEEPVTVRLELSSAEFAPNTFPVWNNGKGAELFLNDKWVEWKYLPIGVPIIIKRKILAIIAGSKTTRITTQHQSTEAERPINRVGKATSSSQAFSVLHDANPRGAPWLTELIRRNM